MEGEAYSLQTTIRLPERLPCPGAPQGPTRFQREDLLLLVASKENTGDLSQSSVSLNSKTGEVLS